MTFSLEYTTSSTAPVSCTGLDQAWDRFTSDFAKFYTGPGTSRPNINSIRSTTSTEGNNAIVKLEVPGVSPEDISVTIQGRMLTVKTPGASAEFNLAQRLSLDEATATLKYGLLTVSVPTREAKKVTVNVVEG
jgi:HSP20 family molecular chaperone IbpA